MDNLLAIYLHDHLAGAKLAVDLLEAMRDMHLGEPLGNFAAVLLSEVEEDRTTLKNLADRIGSGSSQLKEFSAWLSEKVSRIKLNRDNDGLGTFESLEFLALGILGKLALWDALKTLMPSDTRLQGFDLDRLASRAQEQHAKVEEKDARGEGLDIESALQEKTCRLHNASQDYRDLRASLIRIGFA